jgi:hypothetical protein
VVLILEEEVKPQQPKSTIREEIVCKVGPRQNKQENDNDEILNKEKGEEEKDPKFEVFIEDIKLDEYFTTDQQKFYKSLYETELYDRPDLKLIKK